MDDCIVITNGQTESLRFDPAQSYMISYGIDSQSCNKFSVKSLGKIASSSASEVLEAFVSSGAIPAANAELFVASKQLDECTQAGIRRSFCQQARKAGKNGIFVFHFTGHGVKFSIDKESISMGLAPADFSMSKDTLITASILNDWLQESRCEATKIFLIDTCYAGRLVKALEAFATISRLYVMCGCAANESTIALGRLGYSTFSYFLSRSIDYNVYTIQDNARNCVFPMGDIYDDCKRLSLALSSLLVTVINHQALASCSIHAKLAYVDNFDAGYSDVQTDSSAGRLDSVARLYDSNRPAPILHDQCESWLSEKFEVGEPIDLLHRRNLLAGGVLDAAMCSMMYSIAAIQSLVNPQVTKQEPNMFVSALEHWADKIDQFIDIEPLSKSEIEAALVFYMAGIGGADVRVFEGLMCKIASQESDVVRASVRADGTLDEVLVDSGVKVSFWGVHGGQV